MPYFWQDKPKRAAKRAGARLPAKQAAAYAPRTGTSPPVSSTLRNRGRTIDAIVEGAVRGNNDEVQERQIVRR